MQCHQCKTEHDAKFCPNCGAPSSTDSSQLNMQAQGVFQAQPPVVQTQKKRRGCFKWGLAVFASLTVLVVIISIVASRSASQQNPTASGSSDGTGSNTSSGDTSTGPVPLGTDVEIDSFSIRINSGAEKDRIYSDSGYFYYDPEEGAKYIVLSISVKNIDKTMESFQVSNFQLYTSDGVRYSPSSLIMADDFFYIESMNPGIEKSGYVAFQVPQEVSISDLYLVYRSSSFSSNSQKFSIQ